MKCPYCQSLENRVVDSRLARDGRAIRRRRACASCNGRFTTYEIPEETLLDVRKRDGQTEPFDAEKLLRSVRLACKKRPVETVSLSEFVDRLEARLASRPGRVVSSREIGDEVLSFLRGLDPVAYVRYASVYRSFGSVNEFLQEISTFDRPRAAGVLQDDDEVAMPTLLPGDEA
jgi:transcriptional repressor NrdR